VELRLLTEPEFADEFDIAVEDLTDAYVAGEIQGEDRKRAETYFFKSAERQKKLKYAQALKAHEPQTPARIKWWASPQWRIAASIILMVGVAFVLWRVFSRPDDVDKGLLALHEAYSSERPFEARISGLKYAPTPTSLRGEVKVDEAQRKRAESLLEIAVQDRRNAKSLHARGQAYLAARQFDNAIKEFEEALKLSNDAKIHSDLGAALLEKGKRADANQGKGVENFARALEHLTRALELDGSLLEALFNRALTYQSLGLPEKAEQDWRQYLEKDPSSQWSNDASEQLKSVEAMRQRTSQTPAQIFDEFVKHMDAGETEPAWMIVRENQNRSGNVVVEQLIDNYLDRGIDTELNRLASIAEMELVKNGDHFYADVRDFYRSANAQQRALATQARQLMKKSHAEWGQARASDSLKLFTEAKKLFEEAADVAEAKHADYWIAFSHYRLDDDDKKSNNKYENSLKILQPLIAAGERNQYVWLKVRCLYLRSNNEFALKLLSDAVASAHQAVNVAEKINDPVGRLNAITTLVEHYRYLGNYPKSLGQIQRALPILASISLDGVQSSRHYATSAIAFAARGFYDAALDYQQTAMRLGPPARARPAMAYQHAFLGLINGKQRHFDEALNEVNKALEIATTPRQATLIAYSALQKGHIYREMGDCNKAVESYSQSIDLYNEEKFETNIYHAHKGRFLCYVAQKDDARAQHEIHLTLQLMENYRKQIKEEKNRNTFFEIEQSIYDVAIDFEATRMNNSDRAFEYLQSSQARTLLDLMSTSDRKRGDDQDPGSFLPAVTKPESAATIKDKLPENAQLVQYVVLDDKILIWVISRDRDVAFQLVSVSKSVLNETIERYLHIIAKPPNGNQEQQSLAKKLYSMLVQPVASLLDPKKVICIIPNKNLSYLPFAALVSDSGRYLIEEYIVTTSQSPSVFLQCSKYAAEKSEVEEEIVLSVGNPSIDRTAYSQLDDLPNAKREAVKVAEFYKQQRRPLLEANATESEVRNQMPGSDVVHLATHSVLDAEVPSHSKLLLAKGENLHADEIYELTLPRTRLLVLSSCQSGAERYYDGEGMASLARAFLAAGVPLVVASYWPVDSKATEELMVSFHRHRTVGNTTAEALAKAQREMLRDPENRYRSPFYWAAFAVNGGYAEF
jgi:CHAT domain-containing protein/Flp pilus assembly protein TadD